MGCEEEVKQTAKCLMILFLEWKTGLWAGGWILAAPGCLGVRGRF